jgi:hypothetical protein
MAGIGLLAAAEPGFMKPAGADGAAIRSGMGVGVFSAPYRRTRPAAGTVISV